jgi:hypothetical protein
LFSARSPPKPVSIQLLFVGNNLYYAITNWEPSAGTYGIVPQLPAIARHP